MKTALIIVDAQNDFMPGGSLAVPHGDMIIDPINRMTRDLMFDLVVFTKDLHPKNHLSFASQHEGLKPFDKAVINEIRDTVWPDHCVEGTLGSEIDPRLVTELIETKTGAAATVNKGTSRSEMSYSGFMDTTGHWHTDLDNILKKYGIEQVFVCGLAMDFCVFWTAKDAVSLGYSTTIVLDATAPINDLKTAILEILAWRSDRTGKGIELIMSGGIEL